MRGDIERWRAQEREVIGWAMRADVPLMDPPRVPEAAQAMSDEVVRLRSQLAGAEQALSEIASYHEHGKFSALTPAYLAAAAQRALDTIGGQS